MIVYLPSVLASVATPYIHQVSSAGKYRVLSTVPLAGGLALLLATVHAPAGTTSTSCRATGSSADRLPASVSAAAIASCGSGGRWRLVVAHQMGTPAAVDPGAAYHNCFVRGNRVDSMGMIALYRQLEMLKVC